MNLKPFDFSKNIDKLDMYQHLCYYYNEAHNNMQIIKENKQLAFVNFKELYHLLKDEYKEYDKVQNQKNILSNSIYAQYVDNITNAYVKPTNVNSYKMLNSNLYDIKDYMRYGFSNVFFLNDENRLEKNEIDYYLGKICCIGLNNYNVYVGKVDIKLFDWINDKDESISVLFLGKWRQIPIGDIDKIKILED